MPAVLLRRIIRYYDIDRYCWAKKDTHGRLMYVTFDYIDFEGHLAGYQHMVFL